MEPERKNNLWFYDHGDYVVISGDWTIPIKKEKFLKIVKEGYTKEPNRGFYKNDIITLSVFPDDVAKLKLSEEEAEWLMGMAKKIE